MNSSPRYKGGTGRKRTVERAIIDTTIGLFHHCTPVCSWSRTGQPLSRCMKGGRGFSQSRRCYWALPRAVYAEDYQFNDSEFFRKAPFLPTLLVATSALGALVSWTIPNLEEFIRNATQFSLLWQVAGNRW